MSCSALMAFQIVSTNDVPEIMFGLMADYKNGEGGWFIIGMVRHDKAWIRCNNLLIVKKFSAEP